MFQVADVVVEVAVAVIADLAAEAPGTEGIARGPTLALAPNHLVTRAQNLVKNRPTDSMELELQIVYGTGWNVLITERQEEENRAKSR